MAPGSGRSSTSRAPAATIQTASPRRSGDCPGIPGPRSTALARRTTPVPVSTAREPATLSVPAADEFSGTVREIKTYPMLSVLDHRHAGRGRMRGPFVLAAGFLLVSSPVYGLMRLHAARRGAEGMKTHPSGALLGTVLLSGGRSRMPWQAGSTLYAHLGRVWAPRPVIGK